MPPGPSKGRLSPCQYLCGGGWVGAESLAAGRWDSFPGFVGGEVPRPLAHLVKSITMSAWPSCTSVKVSGVTSLHTWRASATVCRTCSRSSCHGNRRILGSTGVVGALGLARRVVSAPAGCPGCTEGAGVQDAGPVCSEGAHCSLCHVGTPSCGLCALRCLRGSALGGKDPGAPRAPPDLNVPLTMGRPWASAPPGSPGSPPRTLPGPPGVPAAMTRGTTPVFTPPHPVPLQDV